MKHQYEKTVRLNHDQTILIVDEPNHKVIEMIDKRTGEVTSHEFEEHSTKGERVEINYKKYLMINLDALEKLAELKEISTVETGYILRLSKMIRTQYNALFNQNGDVHNLETLSAELEMNYSRCTQLIKKFVARGICGKLSTGKRVMYVMNPYLVRNRKFIDREVASIFRDFSF